MIWSKTVLVWSRLEIFVDSGQTWSTFAAGQRSDIGRYKVPTEVSLPGFSIGMINEYFHIVGI